MRVYLFAVLHDRPTSWACDPGNWTHARPPMPMPDQSTLSRRLRRPGVARLLTMLLDELEEADPARGPGAIVRRIDGKPLTVARHSGDKQATFGRGAGGLAKGYKLHAVYAKSNKPTAFAVMPMHIDERRVAERLLAEAGPGYVLGDANYHATRLFDAAEANDQVLVAPRRKARGRRPPKGTGSRPQSRARLAMIDRLEGPDPFVRQLLATRRQVETCFANLCNFGGGLSGLPAWVRGDRVVPWVTGKIGIRLARDRPQASVAA